MKLDDIFKASGISHAHIIDDAYDEVPSLGIGSDVATRFINEIDDKTFDIACEAIDKPGIQDVDFIEALGDPENAKKLFARRADVGDKSDIIFDGFLRDRETKRQALAPLVNLLQDNGVSCKTCGVDYVAANHVMPQLVFIDLRLYEDGKPISVDPAVALFKTIREHHKSCQPFVFLMSTLDDSLKARRDEFRIKAGLFASQFEAVEKKLFEEDAELAIILERYARVLPQLRSLQNSIEGIGFAVSAAVSNVQKELGNLDLADYFVLHRNTISIEKIGLGTYISELVLEYLSHEIENTQQIWDFASELDKIEPKGLPRSRFALTTAASKIYASNVVHAQGRLKAENDRKLGPADGYFYLGDIFFFEEELKNSKPKRALVIATPACDLVRPEELRKRTIFLCEGKVEVLSPSSVPVGLDRLPGVILPDPNDEKKQLLVIWDKKKLHTWHSEQMDAFRDVEHCQWRRVGRLRPLYAIQLQHAITADLSRIGVQRAPNMLVPSGIEVLIKEDGKWSVLDQSYIADASAAAFSVSEDGSRIVFIMADTTVDRVRQKLNRWVGNNKANLPIIEHVDGGEVVEGQAAVGQIEGEKQGHPARALTVAILEKLLALPNFDQRLMYAEAVAEDRSKPRPVCVFPHVDDPGLTEEEAQAFVIVHPTKACAYSAVGGGKNVTEEQTAIVVFKLKQAR